jgi:isopropylmalate/homocitrate/citramalate synthase
LIYDWNNVPGPDFNPKGPVLLDDESLRDGLQSPSVRDPSIPEKLEVLHLMETLGINMADIGLPGAGPRAFSHCEAIAREIASSKLKIKPNCAARTHENDIRPIDELVQKTGVPIAVAMFIGSSPIRRYTENWTQDFLVSTTQRAVQFAVDHGLEVMYVTEDTTRCDPATVKLLYSTAIRAGATTIVIADTCGHATPMGVINLVRYIKREVVDVSGKEIRIDWHGHCDRGMGLANAMAALVAGASCVHATALGIGERVGNTQMDQMLVNLKLMGIKPWDEQDLTRLKEYCEKVARATGVEIPKNYPVFGDDAYRTATGVHAAAVIKAFRKNDQELANNVYSGVPAHFFGLEQIIEIGPMSGRSNILYWLEKRGIPASDEIIEKIYTRAKSSDRVLTEIEVLDCCKASAARIVS